MPERPLSAQWDRSAPGPGDGGRTGRWHFGLQEATVSKAPSVQRAESESDIAACAQASKLHRHCEDVLSQWSSPFKFKFPRPHHVHDVPSRWCWPRQCEMEGRSLRALRALGGSSYHRSAHNSSCTSIRPALPLSSEGDRRVSIFCYGGGLFAHELLGRLRVALPLRAIDREEHAVLKQLVVGERDRLCRVRLAAAATVALERVVRPRLQPAQSPVKSKEPEDFAGGDIYRRFGSAQLVW